MPPLRGRDARFREHAFAMTKRIFDAAPAGLTRLEMPIVPALVVDGLAFSKFSTRLEHLTTPMYGTIYSNAPTTSAHGWVIRPEESNLQTPVIRNIIAALPSLRSMIVRGEPQGQFRCADIQLVSETLETFIIQGDKCSFVTSYQCPKLRTLHFEYLCLPKLGADSMIRRSDRGFGLGFEDVDTALVPRKALERGVHALDLTTVPTDHIAENNWLTRWYRAGFTNGVYAGVEDEG